MVERTLTCTLCGESSSSHTIWRGTLICRQCLDAINTLSFLTVGGNDEANKLLLTARKKAESNGTANGQSTIEYASRAWGEKE